VAVSKAPEVDISESGVRLKLNATAEPFPLLIPDHALPVPTEEARCTFSKKRGELVVEWPCGAETPQATEATVPQPVAAPEDTSPPVEAPMPEEVLSETLVSEEKSEPSAASSESTADVADCSEQGSTEVEADIVQDAAEEVEDPDASVTPEEWRTRGNDAVKTGDLETAIKCYSSGISTAVKSGGDAEKEVLLHSNRALCFHKQARYEEAVDDAKRCVQLKPSFVKGYLRGAMSLRALARPTEALALLKSAPVNDEACALAAEIRPEAEAAEKARIEALPEAERAKEEGNVLFRKGLFEAAAEKYSEALGLCDEPTGALALSLRNNRAACSHQISDFSAVITDTNFVLEHEPRNFKALSRRMLALEPLERYEQALQDARAVLAQDPRNEKANKVQHRLGKLVRDLGRANGGA